MVFICFSTQRNLGKIANTLVKKEKKLPVCFRGKRLFFTLIQSFVFKASCPASERGRFAARFCLDSGGRNAGRVRAIGGPRTDGDAVQGSGHHRGAAGFAPPGLHVGDRP